MTETSSESALINFFVKSQDGRTISFKIKPDIPLSKVMEMYCTQRQLPLKTLRFFYDGRRILKNHTAAQLGIMNGDHIDAMMTVHGGGCKECMINCGS